MLVILESTTYPGTTHELVLPMLAKSGLEVGRDFFLCFSPERVDPGNPVYQTANIPKVVGGCTPACTMMGQLFYSQAIERVVPVGSTQVAEMVKLLENTFRMINIGLANEMEGTAFLSTRSTFPGRPSRRASRRVSLSWRATSMARCRTSRWTACGTP
jgi:UDP-N-acetyl-D-glucosamine dehydrogenase